MTKIRKFWFALSAVLLSAVVFSGPAAGGVAPGPAPVSPVSVHGNTPSLEIRALVRRVDI